MQRKGGAENYDKVMELYNVRQFNHQAVPLPTPPRSEDETVESTVGVLFFDELQLCRISYDIECRAQSPSLPKTAGDSSIWQRMLEFTFIGMYSSSDSLDHHPMQSHQYYDSAGLASTPKTSGIAGAKTGTSSIDGSVRTSMSRESDRSEELSISNASDMETEWVEQDEPGVYITIRALPGGAKELRRVRFSRERFEETHARLWWEENRARIQEQYL
uniref:BRX domain-containing protein n=1 Tax=Salix viminalis TaxID=40686 RepID=A0A6N2MVZ7_SALVM